MEIQLIQGIFSSNDALTLITQMIETKIKFHENKINLCSAVEDIKNRESKIKHLQNVLFELRNNLNVEKSKVNIEALIKID